MSTDVVESDPVPPKGASVHSVEEVNRRKPKAARRIRVNNNLLSTVFSQGSGPDPCSSKETTVKRCTYHKDLNSHEDIFGDPVVAPSPEHIALRCRFTPASNTKENIFGDSDPAPRSLPCIRLTPSAQEDTFDSLFGVPELTQNHRRHYEEDTHCKLFGQPNPIHRRLHAPHEDTQANLFGPPIICTTRVSSRSEDTQLDLFGPPLPFKRSTRQVARSSLQLFAEVVAPSKPVVKINSASYDKLFGPAPPPPEVSRPPPNEDTATRLFGPAIATPPRSVGKKHNPITGEHCNEAPSSPHLQPRPVSSVVSPITGLTLAGPEAEEILQRRRPPLLHWTTVKTIIGDRLDYADVKATQVEEKKEAVTLSSETEKA